MPPMLSAPLALALLFLLLPMLVLPLAAIAVALCAGLARKKRGKSGHEVENGDVEQG